jgi:cell division protein FtsL
MQTSINALHAQRILRELTSATTLLIMVLMLSVIGSALGVVYIKQQTRVLFSELQMLQKQRDDLHIEQTQLMLEQSAWATYGRIDVIAHDKLSMILPSQNDIIMVHP